MAQELHIYLCLSYNRVIGDCIFRYECSAHQPYRFINISESHSDREKLEAVQIFQLDGLASIVRYLLNFSRFLVNNA